MRLDFIIDKWAVWPPLQPTEYEPEHCLSKVPAMLRRRLSPLAKTVFCAVGQCIDEDTIIPAVFSSCHGELAKSLAMMQSLDAGEDVSPTAFSLSVHNAIAGLFSMAWRNRLECTVLAPGEEGIAPAFIEAAGLLQEGAAQVLLVFYDEPLPDFYPSEPFELSVNERRALALVVSANGAGQKLSMSSLQLSGHDGEQPVQLPAFIRFLSEPETELTLEFARHGWRWEKRGDSD